MTKKIDADSNIAKADISLWRWILPDEIANGTLFLISEIGRAVVGDVIHDSKGGSFVI